MKRRRYSVWHNTRTDRDYKKHITEYFVTDAANAEELDDRPAVVSFPVCRVLLGLDQFLHTVTYICLLLLLF